MVTSSLLLDVRVVTVGQRHGSLHRTGHHETRVLTNASQVPHDGGVASVEARTNTREVRALRNGVQRDDPFAAVFENRSGSRGPGVVGVALVTNNEHAAASSPR